MDPGDPKLALLLADLEKPDKPTLRKTVDTLISIAADNPRLAPTLGELLKDPSRKNRWPIAYVLASLPSLSPASLEILIETLDHRDPDIRWAVALLLIRLAKTNGQVLQLLTDLAGAGTANQRRMAIYCLRDLGLADDESVRALLNGLRDPDPTVRVAAVTSLKTKPDLSENRKNEILRLFSTDPDPRVRNSAAVTLAFLGASSEEFLRELAKAEASDNVQLRKAASAASSILKNKRSAPTGS
jgi:HEAT repeat protein